MAQQPRVESGDRPRPRHQDPGLHHRPGGAEAGGHPGRDLEHHQPAHMEQGGHAELAIMSTSVSILKKIESPYLLIAIYTEEYLGDAEYRGGAAAAGDLRGQHRGRGRRGQLGPRHGRGRRHRGRGGGEPRGRQVRGQVQQQGEVLDIIE